MNTRISAAALAALVLLGGLPATAADRSVTPTGYVRNYTGAFVRDDYDLAAVRNTLNLVLERRFGKAGFRVNPVLYHDAPTELELGLREAYLDIALQSFDFRIGKQQIIWGKGEGVFITDIVSPKDMREFLLPDFEEIRVGVTALRADYYLGMNTFELVLVPVFTPTRLPEPDSPWRITPDFPVKPVVDSSEIDVPLQVLNGEVFAKYSLMTPVVDLELMGGYFWDDDPTMHVTRTVDPATRQLQSITVTPEHHRLAMGGGSFSTTIADAVLRGEGGYYDGRYFQTTNPLDRDGVVEKDYLNYLIGVDYTIWDTRLSAQMIQQVILDHEAELVNDQVETMVTFLARRDFLRETLTVELFTYIGVESHDALIRPKVIYDVTDGLELLLGANVFVGDEGRFGRYDDNDMVYVKTTYRF